MSKSYSLPTEPEGVIPSLIERFEGFLVADAQTVSSLPLNPSSTLRVSVLTRSRHCPVSLNDVTP